MNYYNYNNYEEIGLTVVKKLNKKKIIGLIIILIVLVIFMIYLIVIHNKMKKINNNREQVDNISSVEQESEEYRDETNIEENTIENQNIEKSETKLPSLTDEGREKLNNIYKSDEKIAYLTFDDGPSTNITPQILEILDNYNIKATFFLLGMNVDRYPELVKQEYNSGHYIANHGYTHNYSEIYSSSQSVLDEYKKTEESIRTALEIENYSSHLFRFPGGSMGTKYSAIKNEAKQLINENDAVYVDWNALTNDSVGKPTEESIMSNLKETVGAKNSVVVLMHDASTKQLTANMLPNVIEYLKENGYTFKNFYDIII
jgi:peptidoglycan/xylan/chitin deacetylase (PgdA/CDA1 family)